MVRDDLQGKKIVFGITGCIAAYKSCYLIRELLKNGAEVRVVITPSAAQFITPLTLATLSGSEVIQQIFPEHQHGNLKENVWHIETAVWADLMMIVPCSVNTAAKIAHGFSDNALTTLALAMRAPLLISPAADVDMYEKPATRENMETLRRRGVYVLEAEEGALASGLTGKGRMPGLSKILDAARLILSGREKDLTGKKVLVTAGPTYEDIDPVRFLGNRSSGKMGYALAHAAMLRGAEVTLISGPAALDAYQEVNLVKIRSAEEMQQAVVKHLPAHDALIMSAAVADFKPSAYHDKKLKTADSPREIGLTENPDILASIKESGKKVVGFALETDDARKNAQEKLSRKGLNMIVLNSLEDEGSGFELDTNKITIFTPEGGPEEYPLQTKFQTANSILDSLKNIL